MCLLTNERYEIYQMGFSFGHLDHVTGVGLGGTCTVGVAGPKNGFPDIQPNLVCKLNYMNGTCNRTIFLGSPPPKT